MKIVLDIPEEAVYSIRQWLDSSYNIIKVMDDKGQLLNQRRVKTLDDAINDHIKQFLYARMAEFPPMNSDVAAAEEARRLAEVKAKAAREEIIGRVSITLPVNGEPVVEEPIEGEPINPTPLPVTPETPTTSPALVGNLTEATPQKQ